jgi:hypothetical protein
MVESGVAGEYPRADDRHGGQESRHDLAYQIAEITIDVSYSHGRRLQQYFQDIYRPREFFPGYLLLVNVRRPCNPLANAAVDVEQGDNAPDIVTALVVIYQRTV